MLVKDKSVLGAANTQARQSMTERALSMFRKAVPVFDIA
jgi:hypothetical protein